MIENVDVMLLAVQEAELSLREGNYGFGAVIVRGDDIVAVAHDTENTDRDPTAHAEMTAIRKAAHRLGRDLSDCQIFATHEPCPMCSTAILSAGIETVVYGYSIEEAVQQGRKRIRLGCQELFERADKRVTICAGVAHERCAVLYNKAVRDQIDSLRNADQDGLGQMAAALAQKRLAWLKSNPQLQELQEADGGNILDTAYQALLRKLGIEPTEAPIIDRGPNHVSFASRNFCPTLEACRILGLDTRVVCRHLTEKPTDLFLRQVDPRLRFSRNYDHLRPYAAYCEETISLVDVSGSGNADRDSDQA
jgi:tRNA(Arg) A34 adenosine deaminase TadA